MVEALKRGCLAQMATPQARTEQELLHATCKILRSEKHQRLKNAGEVQGSLNRHLARYSISSPSLSLIKPNHCRN